MRITNALMLINNHRLDVLKNTIKVTVAEAPQFINKVKENKKLVYDKISDLNKWYTKLIGLDEVKLYQDKVTSLQEQLLSTQEKRREVGQQLAEVRQKSLELQDEIHKVKRQEDLSRFLDLMKQETEILRLENSISRTFQDYDQTERELFTAFTNAIRDSHEKQRSQVEYTKYFGIILSITGSFLAFMYTTIRKQDLKNFIEEKLSERNVSEPVVLNLVQANQKTLEEIVQNRKRFDEVVTLLKEEGKLRSVNLQVQPGYAQGDSVTTVPLQTNDYTVDLIKVFAGLCLSLVVIRLLTG